MQRGCFQSASYLRKLAAIIELDRAVSDGVILEPHEVKVEHWWELLKHDSFLRVLQPKGPCVVLVVPVQCLRLDVVGEAFFNGLFSLDVQLDVVEGLGPRRLVVHILTPDIRHHFALKETGDGSFHTCCFHLRLQLVKQNPAWCTFTFPLAHM